MRESTVQPLEIKVKDSTYARYMSVMDTVRNHLHIFLQTTQQNNALAMGDIFLFNHFTRFETALPPYLIFKKTNQITRSVAHHSLFKVPGLGNHLRAAGAVPSNMPGLLPFLAKEILRGRKVVIFPEGGMVRDKKVLDENGNYSIYSSSSGTLRPHHKGAAVLAVTLDMLKYHLKTLFAADKTSEISAWCGHLHLSPEQLRNAITKPTLLVPGTITYYPLRTRKNKWIHKLETLFGELPPEALDDIVIESNLLLHKTDISVNFGSPEHALRDLSWADKLLINKALSGVHTTEELFTLGEEATTLTRLYLKRLLNTQTEKVRNAYAHRLYEGITININHLISVLLFQLSQAGVMEINQTDFHKTLYLALKSVQKETDIHLHCTLTRPSSYMGVLEGKARSLQGFIRACVNAGVLKVTPTTYQLTPHLAARSTFEHVRLQNPVQVHYNEAFTVPAVRKIVEETMIYSVKTTAREIALHQFDDEMREFAGQRYRFGKKTPQDLSPNTAQISGRPVLQIPEKPSKIGVLLIHGFASMPSDFKTLADALFTQGYTVLTMRLPGHGTSFHDMDDRTQAEWLAAVRRNHRILTALVEKTVMIGYSTGAVLALSYAAEKPEKLVGVASLAAPYAVHDANMSLLPLVMLIRRTLGWIPAVNKALCHYPFGDTSDATTYHTVPVNALNELRQLIHNLTPLLAHVETPVLLLQGTADTTVKARSAEHILKHLGSQDKELLWLKGATHKLLTEKTAQTFKEINKFMRLLSQA